MNATNPFELVRKHCELAVSATNALTAYLDVGVKEAADQVRLLERTAEALRTAHFNTMRTKFAHSQIREHIYRSINSVNEIIHYASTTVREMEVLSLRPDRHLTQMSDLIRTGTMSLQTGYKKLAAGFTDVNANVEAARETERETEEAYRNALADLFDAKSFLEALDSREHRSDTKFLGHFLDDKQNSHGAAAKALAYVVDMFRRREILQHLSNTADRVLQASDALHAVAAAAAPAQTGGRETAGQ